MSDLVRDDALTLVAMGELGCRKKRVGHGIACTVHGPIDGRVWPCPEAVQHGRLLADRDTALATTDDRTRRLKRHPDFVDRFIDLPPARACLWAIVAGLLTLGNTALANHLGLGESIVRFHLVFGLCMTLGGSTVLTGFTIGTAYWTSAALPDEPATEPEPPALTGAEAMDLLRCKPVVRRGRITCQTHGGHEQVWPCAQAVAVASLVGARPELARALAAITPPESTPFRDIFAQALRDTIPSIRSGERTLAGAVAVALDRALDASDAQDER